MADESKQVETQVTEPAPEDQQVQADAKEMASEQARVEAVAEKYFADKEQIEPTPATTGKVEEAPPAPAPVEKTKLDPVWEQAAKRYGFADTEIAAFKDEGDAQRQIALRRLMVLQDIGIQPADYAGYERWKQEKALPERAAPLVAAQPAPAPSTAQSLSDLKLEIQESELTPELVKPLRAVEKHLNQLQGTLVAENKQLRQIVAGLQGTVQQSVEAEKQAAREAQWAVEWDAAAKEVPGFVEVMGMPSEVRKKTPGDPAVQNYVAFRAYFEPIWNHYANILGQTNVNLQRVMADAFEASPFGKVAKAAPLNGRSGAKLGPGSVVRPSARKTSRTEPVASDLDAETQRALDALGEAWEAAGHNPFRP